MSNQEDSDIEERLHAQEKPNSKPRGLLFGLWPKRSTKVEPHPMTGSLPNVGGAKDDTSKSTPDISFAKCSPLRYTKKRINNNSSHASCSDKNRPCSVKSNYSNNNNRFSHQFSLCCSVEHKPPTPTPPVSVRYNSLPETINIREKLLIDLNNTSCAPLAEVESNSAPETPLNGKATINSNSSPSSNSVQSIQSDGQPKSIAITACRSRLRLKLLPPGKSIIGLNENDACSGKIERQHLSSPNIATQPLPIQSSDNAKSSSHEGIQSIYRTSGSDVCTDSLAKQALMAAQVLSLIPTEKARERNYMAGRLAVTSLLGTSELLRILPNKQITIFVGTWNMNGQNPPKEMNDFVLPSGIEHVPDLVAIGTQESCPERFEWEVTLQETLGPSHILFHSTYLGTLHLAVFLRRDLVWFCSFPEDSSMSVRPGTAFRTKGAVAISFCIFGTTLLFVTSHLTAHQQKVKERVQDVKRITHALDLPRNLPLRHKNKDVTQNFDCVFWCGDLNFRLSEPREKLLEWIQNTKFPLPSHLPHGYMHTDQLSSVLAEGAAFKGFREHNITFPPTYKYDPGTQQFDTSSKQRAPAYTDRILYKYRLSSFALRRASAIGPFLNSEPSPPMECLAYDSVPTFTSSDHKPVWALFRVNIRPGIDSVPLAAGIFNREVYLEGMRRRLNNSYSGSSAVCSVQ